jgi:hypothetical protein
MVLVKAFAVLGLGLLSISVLSAQKSGWINMFDGKTLKGWKANENPESWNAKDGTIVGDGERSHLFWMDRECKNCEFKADVKFGESPANDTPNDLSFRTPLE